MSSKNDKTSRKLAISRRWATYHTNAHTSLEYDLGSYLNNLMVPHIYNTSQAHIHNESEI